MKFTIDKKYLKISVYAVFTLVLFYAFKRVIDIAVFSITNIDMIFKSLIRITGKAFAVLSLPFTGFIIAYLFDPLCDFFDRLYTGRFKRKGKRRFAGVILTYTAIISFFILIIFLIWRYMGKDIRPDEYFANISYQMKVMYNNITLFLLKYGLYDISIKYINAFWNDFRDFFDRIGMSFIEGAAGVGSMLLNILIGFVIAFYFLLDKEKFLDSAKICLKTVLPPFIYKIFKKTALDSHRVFSGYIRGQLTDGIIMSLLIASFLIIFRIRFAVFIGLVSGFSNIIPYFGGIVGFALAVLSALLSGEPLKALYAAVIMIVLQQIDSAVIAPKIVGEKVELSPPAVITALAIGGKLMGIWGMILAVPVSGLIKIIITEKYREKVNDI